MGKTGRMNNSYPEELSQPFQEEAPHKGRPKTKFASIEEEIAYSRAEIEYLKKRYPNLHGE